MKNHKDSFGVGIRIGDVLKNEDFRNDTWQVVGSTEDDNLVALLRNPKTGLPFKKKSNNWAKMLIHNGTRVTNLTAIAETSNATLTKLWDGRVNLRESLSDILNEAHVDFFMEAVNRLLDLQIQVDTIEEIKRTNKL